MEDSYVNETLKEREATHGSFTETAKCSQLLKNVLFRECEQSLTLSQKEALQMICLKLARIVKGDPSHIDSWHDIAGYATLIEIELLEKETDT